MNNFPQQINALAQAQTFIRRLPEASVFALSITDEEDAHVLNIYVPTRDTRMSLERDLFPGRFPVDIAGTFVTFRVGELLISIIEPDERTEDDRIN